MLHALFCAGVLLSKVLAIRVLPRFSGLVLAVCLQWKASRVFLTHPETHVPLNISTARGGKTTGSSKTSMLLLVSLRAK